MSFVIYPAIDLRRGAVVRLKQGDPATMTVYSHDPAETARRWLEAGARWLHVVSLDGALGENANSNRSALKAILSAARGFGAQVQFGGGLRSLDALSEALDLGVSRSVLGTIAITRPDVVAAALGEFGPERVAVAIDARDGIVRVDGWQAESETTARDLAHQMRSLGLRTVVFTDIGRDGMGCGVNASSARELADGCGLDVIASAGVHTLDDVRAARDAGLAGVIIGRALYEGTVDLKDAVRLTGP